MAQQKLPSFPANVTENPNIFAWNALQIDAALAHIDNEHRRNWDSRRHNATKGEALREASRALHTSRADAFRNARTHGQLLFSFHGTKALSHTEGGAA